MNVLGGGVIAAKGNWGTVEWANDSQGSMPAQDFFLQGRDGKDKAKVIALFKLLAERGRISNREKFRQLGPGQRAPGSGNSNLFRSASSETLDRAGGL